MRLEYKRQIKKQMGRSYLAILCIIAIFCTSLPSTTIRTQARVSDGWEIFETNTGDPVAAAYGNGVFALLNNAGVFYISDDAMTWTQTGLLPGTNGETNDTYKMLQMKFINNAFYLYGIKGIFLRSVDGKVWERIDLGNRLVTALTYGDGAWYLTTDGEKFGYYPYQDLDAFALWSSWDGENFTQINTEAEIKACNSLCCAQNKLIVTDPVSNTINTLQMDGMLLSSVDAHNENFESYYAESRYKNDMFLCYFEARIWYSIDAITWNCYDSNFYCAFESGYGEWVEIRDEYYMLNNQGGY